MAARWNWIIWLAFAVELVVMLAVVRDRWAWLRTHPPEVAVVLLTPPSLPSSLQSLRVLRLLRLLRLLRIAKLARRMFSLEGVRWAAVLAALTALGRRRGVCLHREMGPRRGTVCGGPSRR